MRQPRSGVTIQLILSSAMALFIITVALLLGNMNSYIKVPASTILKADYQMESAIIMKMQKIKYGGVKIPDKLDIATREIAPGFILKLITHRVSSNTVRLQAQVKGENVVKTLTVEAKNSNPKNPDGWQLSFVRD